MFLFALKGFARNRLTAFTAMFGVVFASFVITDGGGALQPHEARAIEAAVASARGDHARAEALLAYATPPPPRVRNAVHLTPVSTLAEIRNAYAGDLLGEAPPQQNVAPAPRAPRVIRVAERRDTPAPPEIRAPQQRARTIEVAYEPDAPLRVEASPQKPAPAPRHAGGGDILASRTPTRHAMAEPLVPLTPFVQ